MALSDTLLEHLKEINRLNESLLIDSHSKLINELKKQETQNQKLLKSSLMPSGALDAINNINLTNKIYLDSINSTSKKLLDNLFGPHKFIDSVFDSTTSRLFKELSESPLKQLQILAFPENPIDLIASKHILDFQSRYKDSLKLLSGEISSAIAISKILGPARVNAHYEEILKELERVKSVQCKDIDPSLQWSEIRSILLALLMFLYQEFSSNQMEERLTDKIDLNKEQLAQQINKVELLIQNIPQLKQTPFKNAEYVVKDRSALVRSAPRNGSKVIAQIFPNQVVTIIDNDGKWIEITYYDWLSSDYMNGWVLKKYLERIQSVDVSPATR